MRLFFPFVLIFVLMNLLLLVRHLDQIEHLFLGQPGDVVLMPMRSGSTQNHVSSLARKPIKNPYAYAFVMGAIHEDRLAYKGFLYDVLIAANLLRQYGSTADIWLWAQLSPDSKLQHLPEEDLRLLNALNVHIEQLPKPKDESFASIVFEKFRPLQMTQYSRVMFLDSDIIPLVNLDYLFHLTDPNYGGERISLHLFRPNVIIASRAEPCNAGLFILEPEEGGWERVQEVIKAQRENAKDLDYPFFDWYDGWGHNFVEEGDHWDGIAFSSQRWRYHGGHSDQGLLYYYLKYIKQDVSIIIGNRTESWIRGESGRPVLSETISNLESERAPKPSEPQHSCGVPDEEQNTDFAHLCLPIYRDFCHFMGTNKPWQIGVVSPWGPSNSLMWNAPYRLWWSELTKLNSQHAMGLDIEKWDTVHLKTMRESPLGYIAEMKDHAKEIPKTAKLDVERLCIAEKPYVNNTLPLAAALAELQSSINIVNSTEKNGYGYAYAFLVDQIHESQLAYKGSLYTVLVAVSYLRKLGSQADFVVFVKLMQNSELQDLPKEDQRLLSAMNIQVERIAEKHFFKLSGYDALRVFQLTQYRRVMFLSKETMPLVNLDYLFYLSDPKLAPTLILRPNMIIASKFEPSNTALFIVEPKEGVLKSLEEIMERTFDVDVGWGHNFIAAGDQWESVDAHGERWNYSGANSPNGLLYYYLKYVKHDVSILVGNKIQNRAPGGDTNEIPHGIDPHFPTPIVTQYNCGMSKRVQDPYYQHLCLPIYLHFAWFHADLPWIIGLNPDPFFGPKDCQRWHAPYRVWFKELGELNSQLKIGLDMEHWDTVHMPQMKGILPD